MEDEKFKLIKKNNIIEINPLKWNLGYCTDGDFNSISIEFKHFDIKGPYFFNEFFTIESNQWIVEKASISSVSIDNYTKIIGTPDYLNEFNVKLLIHFHSKIIRGDDMEMIKKFIARKNIIKNILKK